MLRHASLAVLAFIVLLTALPASAAVQPNRPEGTLAGIISPTEETGDAALLSPHYDVENKACVISCEPWYTTPMFRGTGVDCTAAYNNLVSQIAAYGAANGAGLCNGGGAAFGYCGYTVHVTVPCHWDFVLGLYVVDGYGYVKCRDYC